MKTQDYSFPIPPLNLSAYLVVGPENTKGRPVATIVKAAITNGFTCVQIRSKVAGARELISLCEEASTVIAEANLSNKVTLLVDDRLDVVYVARQKGIKVDGIHVGQSDIPPEICRELLGPNAIIGLSARTTELLDYVKKCDTSSIDYFGAGPLHKTASKPDCGLDENGHFATRSLSELSQLHRISSLPVVVGGGVKEKDLPALKQTGVDGFFCISTVAGADNPAQAAKQMSSLWKEAHK